MLAVYTANFGSYDKPRVLSKATIERLGALKEKVDFLYFTDNAERVAQMSNLSEIYAIIQTPCLFGKDYQKMARAVKIQPHIYLAPHTRATHSLWLDSFILPLATSFEQLISPFGGFASLVCAEKHYERDCAYEECDAVLALNCDIKPRVEAMRHILKQSNYPEHNLLSQTAILWRNHADKNVIDAMNFWYRNVIPYSGRDQLSFDFSMVSNKIPRVFSFHSLDQRDRLFNSDFAGHEQKNKIRILNTLTVVEAKVVTESNVIDVTERCRKLAKKSGNSLLFLSKDLSVYVHFNLPTAGRFTQLFVTCTTHCQTAQLQYDGTMTEDFILVER